MSGGDTARRGRALQIFDEVADLPADERAARLHELCGGDVPLRARVEMLLAADASDAEPVAGDAARWSSALQDIASSGEAMIGRQIGAWRVTAVLGRGGMGMVYAVERADGAYAQRAALKLIRSAADSPLARERFLRERQTLAQLQHPHIATLLDGGFTAQGDPYFVMEYVDGVPIDRWCDQHRLGLHARVELFGQVLDAVQYAHRNLMVHRDLKPSNLLVDQEGRVKLLDFGIAKQLQAGDATHASDRALTFEYASPEQLHDAPITTATDVWQLGIVLHRLLSGAHPFGLSHDTPLARQLQQLERAPEPLDQAAAHATVEQAACRGDATPAQLARAVRGNLAAITATSLQRAPEARYASAEALAADLRRWLENRPIVAARPGQRERLRLWVRRNRAFAASLAALAVVLVAGTGVSLWLAHEAREQARVAERQSANARAAVGFLTDTLAAASPEQALDTEVSVRQLLDRARAELDKRSSVDPQVRQPVQRMLGHLYASLGEPKVAAGLFAAGLQGVQAGQREEALGLANDLAGYSAALGSLERSEESLAVARQAAALRERFAPRDPEQRLRALHDLGYAYRLLDAAEAEKYWREALRLADTLPDPPVDVVINVYQQLSAMFNTDLEGGKALQFATRGLDFADRQGVPAESGLRVELLRHQAIASLQQGDPAAAESMLRRTIELHRHSVGEGGIFLGNLYNDLAIALNDLGRYSEAIQALQRAEQLGAVAGDGLPEDAATSLNNIGAVWESAGDYAQAMAYMRRGLARLEEAGVPVDKQIHRRFERNYARALGLSGHPREAWQRLERLREQARALDGEDSAEYAFATWQAAKMAQRMRDPGLGVPLLEEAARRWAALVPAQHPIFDHAHRLRAAFARMRGDRSQAQREQRAAVAGFEAGEALAVDLAIARAELAAIEAEGGDRAAARQLLAQALPVLRDRLLPQEVSRDEAEVLARQLGLR